MSSKLLQTAVADRKVVAFDYDDKPRIVEPHALGRNKVGDLVLRAFQVGGDSASSRSHWKLFTVEKITNPLLIDMPSYAPRAGYKAGDKVMTEIIAELPDAIAEAA